MESSKNTKNASDLDINVANPGESPTDTVSSISWTPNGNNLTFATSDWASCIRIYDVDPDASILTQQACFDARSPCLSVKWHEDERTVFTGCTDGSVKSFDVSSGKCSLIGKHEGPVKGFHWISEPNTLLTVSFDKTVRFWDPRQATHVAGYRLYYKPFCSDMLFPYLAIGLSDAKCLIVNLRNAEAELGGRVNYLESPLERKTQISSIRLFGGEKYGIGTSANYERCNISRFEPHRNGSVRLAHLMTFKAHKVDSGNIKRHYPVNTIGFHPHRGSDFVYTTGGDGEMIFWDHKKKHRTVEFYFGGVPATQAEFDPTGNYMAYSLGYDWARGIGGYMTQPTKICVHRIQERELQFEKDAGYSIKYR